jgi:SNF2 family DNA or RNA helicase
MFIDYEYRFLVASYEHFYKYSDSLGSKCDLIIFDEGHRLKNKKSKLFKKIQQSKCRKRILLTGTPIQNNLEELYTCITLVNPSFFESELVFKNVFQKPIIAGMAKCASKELRTLALSRTAELANLIK